MANCTHDQGEAAMLDVHNLHGLGGCPCVTAWEGARNSPNRPDVRVVGQEGCGCLRGSLSMGDLGLPSPAVVIEGTMVSLKISSLTQALGMRGQGCATVGAFPMHLLRYRRLATSQVAGSGSAGSDEGGLTLRYERDVSLVSKTTHCALMSSADRRLRELAEAGDWEAARDTGFRLVDGG
jgi:hypothetical protein